MKINEQSRGIWSWDLVKLVLGFSLVLFAFLFQFYGFSEEGTREAIRWSARISFFCFCVAFSVTAAHGFFKNSFSFWLIMNRKFWGISFAIIHLIHFGFLVILQQYFHPVFEMAASSSLFAGGFAYLFLILMLLTSFKTFSKYLSSKEWKALHLIGGYWIWAIYMSSYYKRSLTEYEHIPLVIILLMVLLLRLWSLSKKKGQLFSE